MVIGRSEGSSDGGKGKRQRERERERAATFSKNPWAPHRHSQRCNATGRNIELREQNHTGMEKNSRIINPLIIHERDKKETNDWIISYSSPPPLSHILHRPLALSLCRVFSRPRFHSLYFLFFLLYITNENSYARFVSKARLTLHVISPQLLHNFLIKKI